MADEPPASTKPRGRPRVAESGSNVSAWIKTSHHDKLIAIAKKHDISVSRVVAALIARTLR